MSRKIKTKYAFGTYANDVMGVNLWVSKSEYNRMMCICDHQMLLNELRVSDDFKVEKRTELRYNGETYTDTCTIYTIGTTDFEFMIREAKDGFFFKSGK